MARSITYPDQRAQALAAVADALARVGQYEQAAAVARSIHEKSRQAQALAAVAEASVETGQHEQAITMAARAETVARSITDRSCGRRHGIGGARAGRGRPV